MRTLGAKAESNKDPVTTETPRSEASRVADSRGFK